MIFVTHIKQINFSFIILLLIPISFVIGPLITEILINILSLIFLYNAYKERKIYILKIQFLFTFLFFIYF